MRSAMVILFLACSLAGMGSLYSVKRQTQLADPIAPKSVDRWPDQVAADGVVEVARPEVPLRLSVVGTLASITARESQNVSEGALLAELQNRSQIYQVALSAAEVAIAKAQLERLLMVSARETEGHGRHRGSKACPLAPGQGDV